MAEEAVSGEAGSLRPSYLGFMHHPWATIGRGKGGEYHYFDREAVIEAEWGHNLPHWRQGGVIYFITFRAADSMPESRVRQWQAERAAWLAKHPPPQSRQAVAEYHRLFTRRWQSWLDESHGACVLKDLALRRQLEEILRHGDGDSKGYALDEFVIMPNHVHALVAPQPHQSLSRILREWKSISAHRINRCLGRRGAFWQEESWDHIVRSCHHLDKYRAYIRNNPAALPDTEG